MRLTITLLLALACCRPTPAKPAAGELPPLPPASGTAVGYLVDASGDLGLREEQLIRLKELDASLVAQNGQVDAQLRQLERPMPQEGLSPQEQKAGVAPSRYNNAPGASTITTDDSMKLHEQRAANDRAALNEALALLDPDQRATATKILEARGIAAPPEAPAKHAR